MGNDKQEGEQEKQEKEEAPSADSKYVRNGRALLPLHPRNTFSSRTTGNPFFSPYRQRQESPHDCLCSREYVQSRHGAAAHQIGIVAFGQNQVSLCDRVMSSFWYKIAKAKVKVAVLVICSDVWLAVGSGAATRQLFVGSCNPAEASPMVSPLAVEGFSLHLLIPRTRRKRCRRRKHRRGGERRRRFSA